MFKQIHFSTIDSTHEWALRNISSLKTHYSLISADYQTAGRGRKGAVWVSPPHLNLLLTFVFPIEENLPLQNLAQLLAHSAIQTLMQFGFSPLFKWPNDLLLSGKKVGGIKVDIKSPLALASIGINVNMPQNFISEINQPATSLLLEKSPQDLQALKLSLLDQFQSDLSLFKQKGFAPFFSAFSSRLAYIGCRATIENQEGTIIGLHPDGRLILNVNNLPQLFTTGTILIKRNSIGNL